MSQKNMDIRIQCQRHGLRLYEVGECLGYSPSGFTVYLRHELTDEQKQKAFEAITKLYNEKYGSGDGAKNV